MQTIQTSLINQGAAVKDDPNASAADIILQADSLPLATVDLVSPVVPVNEIPPPANVVPNVAIIGEDKPHSNKTAILIAAGVGALLLFTNDGKKAIEGIAGIGKKKKEGNKKSGSAMPLLLVGGAAAAYLYFKKKDTATPGTDNTTPGTDNTNSNTLPPPPAGFVFTPITVPTTDAAIHQVLYNYSVPWRYNVDRMTPAERLTLYLYTFGYIERHIRLYSFPGTFPDGNYDPQLYADVLALNNKWHMGLLN